MIDKNFLAQKLDAILSKLKDRGVSATAIATMINFTPSVISKMRKANVYPQYYKAVSLSDLIRCISEVENLYSITTTEIQSLDRKIVKFNVEFKEETEFSDPNDKKYIYYFIDNSYKPNKALLIVSKRKKRAMLTTFSQQSAKRKEGKTYFGVISSNENNLKSSIYFTKEKGSANSPTINSAFSSYCCFEGDIYDKEEKIGVYASSKRVSCGIVYIVPLPPNNNELEMLSNSKIPPFVYTIISDSRYSFNHKNDIQRIYNEKKNIIKHTKDLKGVYEGYTFFNRSNSIIIQRLVIEILDDSIVHLKSIGCPQGKTGRITQVRRDRNVVIQFTYQKRHGYYMIQIVLDLMQGRLKGLKRDNILIGTYGGIEETSESPIAGKIILFPEDKETFETLKIETYPINSDNTKMIENLFSVRNWKGRVLKRFFRGELENFTDPSDVLKLCPSLKNEDNTFTLKYQYPDELKKMLEQRAREIEEEE